MTATAVTLIFGGAPAGAHHGGAHCEDIPDVNIIPGHPNWDPVLDNDNDGVACEDSSQPNWSPPVTEPPVTTPPVTEAPAPAPEPVVDQAVPAAPVEREPDYTG